MNKTSILIIAFVIIVGGLVFFFNQREPSELPAEIPSAPVSELPSLPPPPSPPAGLPATASKQHVITHTNAGYTPATLMVNVGDTITFKNESSQETWPASALHPTHSLYPTTGGCLGSTFDACRGITPGGEWKFTFEVPGTWKYHNHLNPAFTGAVVVE